MGGCQLEGLVSHWLRKGWLGGGGGGVDSEVCVRLKCSGRRFVLQGRNEGGADKA